ncbi:MAG: hypothetical protein A2583_02260 [Bdellovibrionales bacterium RIFOXYD1_FULL_53_11]|nr:MAG: hypothetical protein A2583_02260 [Bdellovibrionales bacterium RIFOXYD1_FULL_53_11]
MKLRIIENTYSSPQHVNKVPIQTSMFACAGRSSYGFIGYNEISGVQLLTILKSTLPSHIVDLRIVQKFDKPDLGRRLFFANLQHLDVHYIDFATLNSIVAGNDWRFNPQFVGYSLVELISKKGKDRPVLFLVEDLEKANTFANTVPGCFSDRSGVAETFISDSVIPIHQPSKASRSNCL